MTLDHAAYERILAHVDDYLEVDPESLGAPDRVGYLADLRVLLETRVEAVELAHETQVECGAERCMTPDDGGEALDAPAHTAAVVPLRNVEIEPISPREQRRINKRNAVHDMLVETEWDCTETARRLNIDREAIRRIARRYWPDHPPFDNARITKNVLLRALLESDWKLPSAARKLGVPKSTVYRSVKRYNLRRPDNDRATAAGAI